MALHHLLGNLKDKCMYLSSATRLQLTTLLLCYIMLYYTDGASLKQQILDSLLVNTSYDKRVPPGVDFGELEEERPTEVTVQLYITEIYDVNVDAMDFSITFYLRQTWTDYRLEFKNPNVSSLQLDQNSIERVWTPDTYFPESKSGYFHELTKPNILMHVFSNGTVIYSMRLRSKISCNMEFHLYPMDLQECKFHLQSYGFTSDKVSYKWKEKDPVTVTNENIPLYDIPGRPPTINDSCRYGFFLNRFSCLETTIQLRRSIGYYMTEVFIPDILIVVMSWVSFWLHPLAVPARVSLGAVTVLTMSSQGSASRRNAPKVSYIKAIDGWTLFQVLFVFAAMVEFSIVNVLARKKKYIFEGKSNDSKSNGKTDPATDKNDRPFLSRAKRIDFVSRFVFPSVYLLFNILFWTIVTHVKRN